MRVPAEVRFREKIYRDGHGCWLWQGSRAGIDYGNFWDHGRNVLAHRWAYEHFVGPIPEGLQIDHLCRVRNCVNPDHLETVTARENTLRGEGVSAQYARATHCKRGHELAGDNLRILRRGERRCKTCAAYRQRKYYWAAVEKERAS